MISLVLTGPLVRAHTPPDSSDHNNAATYYNQAFDFMQGKLTPEESNLLSDYAAHPGTPPSPEVLAALQKVEPAINLARQASRAGYSDFGLDFSQGVDMILPHLTPMRQLARYLMADTNVKVSSGDNVNAAKDIAAMYHMAGNTGDDRVLISSLVGMAVMHVADQNVSTLAGAGQLDPDTASIILEATKSFDQNDPCQVANSILSEGTVMAATFQRALDAVKSGKVNDFKSAFNQYVDGGQNDPFENMVRNMSADQVQSEVNKYQDLMNAYSNAFSIKDPDAAKAAIDRITDGIGKGDYGMFAKYMAPAMGRVYESFLKSQAMNQAQIDLLEKVVQGHLKQGDLRNAAIWYERAIHAINTTLDPKMVKTIDTFDPANPDKAFEPADDAKADQQPGNANVQPPDYEHALGSIVQTLKEASVIRLCDFTFGQSAQKRYELLLPDYVQGMHQCINVLLIDAHRLVREGHDDEALDRLATAMLVIRHFSSDGLLLSSAVSQKGWDDLLQLTNHDLDAIEAKAKPESYGQTVFASRQMSPSDPFGYRKAGGAIRDNLPDSIASRFTNDTMHSIVKANALKIMHDTDADTLVTLLLYDRYTTTNGELLNPKDDESLDPQKELHDRSVHLPSPLVNLPDLAQLAIAGQPLYVKYITWYKAMPSSTEKKDALATTAADHDQDQADLELRPKPLPPATGPQPDMKSFALPPLLTLDDFRQHARADLGAGVALFDSLARKHPVPSESTKSDKKEDNNNEKKDNPDVQGKQ